MTESKIGFGKQVASFPPVFWVANTIEVLERFSYYGIYFGFGIYMESLGYSRGELGIIQSIFLFISYGVPIISGTFADRYGFKKVLIVSYLAYLPSILLLIFTKSFSGIALTMLSIGLAAGIFKPLISGCVRAVSSKNNKTLGFGIFYAMVNVGGSVGPMVAGNLRAISWNYAFVASAISIGVMLLITIFFFKEPERELEGVSLGQKFRDLWVALSDLKFTTFLILLGFFFWLPFWAFFNLCAVYVDSAVDTAQLYTSITNGLGAVVGTKIATAFTGWFSHEEDGVRKILGETISHTGWIIIFLQIFISKAVERFKAIPAFNCGLFIAALGFIVLGLAYTGSPMLIFLGIFLFAVGEMIASPRIQEYITWIAPKEKAGLYMGANFLSVMIGGFVSGFTYTTLSGYFSDQGHPDYVWYVLAAHTLIAILVMVVFVKTAGEFSEREE